MTRTEPRTAPLCTTSGIRARMLDLTDLDLQRLSGTWRDDPATQTARATALHVDLPGVITTLQLLDEVDVVLAQEATDPATRPGVHAVRDALACSAAGAALPATAARLLLAPWLRLPAPPGGLRPSPGPPRPELARLLGTLATACHDPSAADTSAAIAAALDADHEAACRQLQDWTQHPALARRARLAEHITRRQLLSPHRCPRPGPTVPVVSAALAAAVADALGAPVDLRQALDLPFRAHVGGPLA